MEYGHPVGEQGVLREGLQKIERYYACDKLATVHELLLNTEEYGGDVEASVTLVLEDIERFKSVDTSFRRRSGRVIQIM